MNLAPRWPLPGDANGPGPETALAELIAQLRRAMRRAARAADPANPLAVAQLELLSCLAERAGARPSELARTLRLAPNSVTTLVNGLVSHGMITRSRGGRDRRAVSLRLTSAGAQAVRNWQAANAGILHAALATLPAERQYALFAALPALGELTQRSTHSPTPHPAPPRTRGRGADAPGVRPHVPAVGPAGSGRRSPSGSTGRLPGSFQCRPRHARLLVNRADGEIRCARAGQW